MYGLDSKAYVPPNIRDLNASELTLLADKVDWDIIKKTLSFSQTGYRFTYSIVSFDRNPFAAPHESNN